ncbi:MAG: LysR family transcriptional regulator [Clostridia bacterium]|nr:LysR family transcriptional regulator [Clostridia bacterium]
MTLQQMRYAITIAQCGSMNKAADILFVSQPSLTGAVRAMEEELGITIFKRSKRGVTVTNDGAEFLQYVQRIYRQYEILEEKYGNGSKLKRKFGVSTQHYSFAIKAFVEMVKKYDTAEYEFAIRETRTKNVITDVGTLRSEIGILYMSDFNKDVIKKLLRDNDLDFHKLIECNAYVYIYKGHPLANAEYITFDMLKDYPCLSFEQGEESFYLAEEILSENEYTRVIKATDRATMLNLMVGLNGYTLCSGIICEELNGSDYVAVPFRADADNKNPVMEIGYIVKRNSIISNTGENYIEEIKKYLDAK